MNTRTSKFLAIVAVLAMAFVAVAVLVDADQSDADGPAIGDFTISQAKYDDKVTNATIGNVLYFDATENLITGYVNKVTEANMGAENYAVYAAAGAPAGYEYAIEFTIELKDNNYLSWINGHNGQFVSKTGVKDDGQTYCTMLLFVKDMKGSKSYAITPSAIDEDTFNDPATKKYTISWDLEPVDAKVVESLTTAVPGVIAVDTSVTNVTKVTLSKDVAVSKVQELSTGSMSYEFILGDNNIYGASNDLFALSGASSALKITAGNNGGVCAAQRIIVNTSTTSAIELKGGSYLADNRIVNSYLQAATTAVADVTASVTVSGITATVLSDSNGVLFNIHQPNNSTAGTTASTQSKFSISDSTLISAECGIWFGNGGTGDVVISNTSVTAYEAPIYLGSVVKASLSNVTATMIGEANSALEIKSGAITVNGGSFNSNAYEAITSTSDANNDGTGSGYSAVLINNQYEKHGAAVNVSFTGVSINNEATNSYGIIVAPSVGTTDITIANNGTANSIIISEYQKSGGAAISGQKNVVLKTSTFSDFMIDALVAGENKVKVATDNVVKATGSIIIAGNLDGKIENESGKETDVIDVTPSTGTIDDVINKNDSESTDTVVKMNDTMAAQLATEGKTVSVEKANLALVASSTTTSLTNFEIEVKSTAGESKELSFTGFTGGISGTIKTSDGTTTQTMKLNAVKGDIKIYKGSIIIDGKEASGIFELADGADVKMSGTLKDGNLTIKMASSTAKATVTIEEEAHVTILDGSSLIIDKGVTLNVAGTLSSTDKASTLELNSGAIVNISGTVSLGKVKNAGTVNVNEDGKLKAIDDVGTAMDGSGKYVANNGSTVEGKYTQAAATSPLFTAYSGSDINDLTVTNWANVIGKDAASGTWTYASGSTTLKLSNYNGTYNFGTFSAALTAIDLVGSNAISCVADAEYAGGILFGSAITKISTVEGSATLAINVDLSAAAGANLANKLVVIDNNTEKISIDAVAVSIVVSGYNSDWTEKQIAAGQFEGICAKGLNLYNADLDVNVMATYAAEGGIGVHIVDGADFEITSCEDVMLLASGTAAVVADELIVKDTIVVANGQLQGMTVGGDITVSNYATVTIVNGLVAGDKDAPIENINISQESILAVDDLNLYGALTNNGKVILTGESIVQDVASITNNALFSNSGVIGVYGTITNGKDGVFDNEGSVFIYAYKLPGDVTLTLHPEAATTPGTLAKLLSVTIDDADMVLNADGTITVNNASLTFQSTGADSLGPVAGFEGTLTYSQVDDSYTLILATEDAAMSITYDDTKATKALGEAYSLTLSGEVTVAEKKYTLETNTSTTAITDGMDNIKGEAKPAAAALSAKGTFDNEDGIVYLYTNDTTPVALDGTFIGNFFSAGSTTMAGKMTGTIYSKGDVTITGTLEGDIYTAGAVNIDSPSSTVTAKVIGNVIMNNSDDSKNFTLNGEMDGYIKYITEYNTVTSGTPVMQVFTATMTIKGTEKDTGDGMVITATIGKNATTTTAAVGGCFVLTKAADLATGKKVGMALTEGKFSVPKSVTLPASYELVIMDDTTIEVAKTATFTIGGGLKVADGAERNYELVSIPVKYGKLAYVMMFDIAEGYTVFSNVEYALSNCDENSDLTVGSKTTVTSNVAIKKGVKVYVDNVELGIDKYDLSMDEGAQIILLGNAKVTFAATGDKDTLGVKTLYYVDGTIVYGEDNVIAFTDVRFDAASSVTAIPATSTTDSKLGLDLHLNDGVVVLESGLANGTVDLNNLRFDLNGTATKVSGKYTVALGATSEAAVTDAAEVTTKGSEVPATAVVVNGTMKVSANMDITGTYAGLGSLVLADGKVVSVADKAVVAITIGNGEDAFGLITDAGAYTIASVAKTTSAAAYVKLDGALDNGAITAVGNTAVGTLALGYTAATAKDVAKMGALSVPEGATLTVLTKLTANGAVGNAGTLNYKTEETPSYGTLEYEITFLDDGYTIYTMLNTALDLVEPGTEIVIEDNLDVANKTIPLGVSIVIAPGHYLTVSKNSYLIIGAETDALGAGATLSGAVVLKEGAYVIDFVGSGSEIGVYTDIELTKAAAYNMFLVDDVAFATVYAYESSMVLTLAPAVDDGKIDLNLLVPEVEGFYFEEWTLQNGVTPADGQKLSAGPFTASMIASKVSVIFATVAGINYYVDGEIVNTLDAPVKCEYGATVTAKISDTSKYQGTPLVNGKAYILIDDEVSKVTGSGVNPIPVPPEPEPEPVVGDSGLSLTDILLIVLVILIAIMVVILVLRLNRS